jgi:hypothetical protein
MHSLSNESAPDFDVVSAVERLSQTSQATTIEPFPDDNMDDPDPPNPSHFWDMGHLEDAELQKIKTEGAKLSLHIERCLQQQTIAQTHPRTPVLAVKYTSSISERDAERRQHQEEISLLAEKLIDKETECKSLKTQNRISGLQTDLADAKKRIERLRETVARQNEEIPSLKKNQWSYLDVFDPPSYEKKAAFSSSVS